MVNHINHGLSELMINKHFHDRLSELSHKNNIHVGPTCILWR